LSKQPSDALGFSLNNLTLFGLVLAIGIVVDDAIMVLENIERLIATRLDARTATIKAMDELTGPIIAITLVLSSVFLPSCFIPGLTGQFYRQFALTIFMRSPEQLVPPRSARFCCIRLRSNNWPMPVTARCTLPSSSSIASPWAALGKSAAFLSQASAQRSTEDAQR
jgi:AcrB/AcrD/AcrF family